MPSVTIDAEPEPVGAPSLRIGSQGPMGRILVRSEAGHDIVPELAPREGEPLVDKPGDRSAVDPAQQRHRELNRLRRHHRSVCSHDGAGGQRSRLSLHLCMVKAQGGIFGWVSDVQKVLSALA